MTKQELTQEMMKAVEGFFTHFQFSNIIIYGRSDTRWTDTIEGLGQCLEDSQKYPLKMELLFRQRDKVSRAKITETKLGFRMQDSIVKVDIHHDERWYLGAKTEVEKGLVIPGFRDFLEKYALIGGNNEGSNSLPRNI